MIGVLHTNHTGVAAHGCEYYSALIVHGMLRPFYISSSIFPDWLLITDLFYEEQSARLL